ncbi:unnamed protein product, partial [Polarella glacialis]
MGLQSSSNAFVLSATPELHASLRPTAVQPPAQRLVLSSRQGPGLAAVQTGAF